MIQDFIVLETLPIWTSPLSPGARIAWKTWAWKRKFSDICEREDSLSKLYFPCTVGFLQKKMTSLNLKLYFKYESSLIHIAKIMRNLYAGQEATVRTGHGTTDWFQIGKWVRQGYILSPCLFNFYAEYITRNIGLEEEHTGIKIAGRNINKLRYADDSTLMAGNEEDLKSLLMKVKEESERLA